MSSDADLRRKAIRLAHSMPEDSEARKALIQVLAETRVPAGKAATTLREVPGAIAQRGQKASKLISQMSKNLDQAMSRYSDDSGEAEKWMLRLFGVMLVEGMERALGGLHEDLAQECYALGRKIQQRYKK